MRARGWLLAVVLMSHGLLAWAIASQQANTTRFAQVDFNTYYAAAVLWAEGRNPYDGQSTEDFLRSHDLAYIPDSNYIYPPYFAAVLSLGIFLPLLIFGFLWYVVNLASLAMALCLILRGQRLSASDALPLWRDALVFACLFAPVCHAFYVGQTNAVLLLLVAAAFLCCQRGREVAAGVLLGIATLIKISPGLLALHFLLARRHIALVAMAVTTVGIPVITLPFFRDDLAAFFATVPQRLSQPMPHLVNQSLNGFFSRLFTTNAFTEPVVALDPVGVLTLVKVVSLVVFFWVLALLVLRRRELDRNADLSFGALITLPVIVSPFSWENFYLLLLFPILALVRRQHLIGTAAKGAIVLSVALISAQRLWDPFTNAPADFPALRAASPLMSLGLYGAFILLGLQLTREAWRD